MIMFEVGSGPRPTSFFHERILYTLSKNIRDIHFYFRFRNLLPIFQNPFFNYHLPTHKKHHSLFIYCIRKRTYNAFWSTQNSLRNNLLLLIYRFMI